MMKKILKISTLIGLSILLLGCAHREKKAPCSDFLVPNSLSAFAPISEPKKLEHNFGLVNDENHCGELQPLNTED